jgi:Fur family ferric uptake transcriptional regulator
MTRNTKQRAAIREVVEEAGRPLSADEILAGASGQVSGLGLATVYRSIKDLLDEEWLTAVELPGEPPRYERAGKAHHHHFHCCTCGKVFEIEGCPSEVEKLVPPGFRVSRHEILLHGSCPVCANDTIRLA